MIMKKRTIILVMSLIMVLSNVLVGCNNMSSNDKNNIPQSLNNDNKESESKSKVFKQKDYPKWDDIECHFVNGVSYGEPAALMGYTNNSKYTIVSILIDYVVKEDATQEELAVFDNFVKNGDLEAEKISTLRPYIYNYMVCDPGETVEGVTCSLFGIADATDAKQCELLVVKNAEISFQGDDGLIYTVAFASENEGYTLQNGAEPAKTWTEKDFAKTVPVPDTRFVTVNYDDDDYYQFTAYDITYEQYRSYCTECQDAGFTNEIEDNDISFWCTNESGLTLHIVYNEYMNALITYAE